MKHVYRRTKSIAPKAFKAGGFFIFLLLLSGIINKSCQKDFEIVVSNGDPISLSASETDIVLSQKQSSSNVIELAWTRGSNEGTGSPISYTLELDISGNNFSSAISYEMGMAIYTKSFKAEELNALLLDTFNIEGGTSATLEARIIADVFHESVEDDISAALSFQVTSYEPVTETLYILGTATSVGDDITQALEMTSTPEKPWEFIFEGELGLGRVFFSETQDDCWCKTFYTKNTSDEGLMIRNDDGLGNNKRWLITSKNYYKIVVDLIDLKIQIDTAVAAPYTELYMVGDASPSGWDIINPQPFTQNPDNTSIFTYEAYLAPGEFKIATFTGDWCDGDWLNASVADQDISGTDFIITHGCDGPDNQWVVTEETQGRYTITVNFADNSISIEPVQLYLIGDGGPNGWNIENPEPMVFANGKYTFTGPLGLDNPTGEFKFSKFVGNWCDGGWILGTTADQSITNTSMSFFTGCPPDELDFKWRLQAGEAGDYIITIDLENEQMTITKQ